MSSEKFTGKKVNTSKFLWIHSSVEFACASNCNYHKTHSHFFNTIQQFF